MKICQTLLTKSKCDGTKSKRIGQSIVYIF